MTATSRSHRNRAVVESKLARLREPHVAPLTKFVERLRKSRGGGATVPWFDPDEAGTRAKILALLEAPGGMATGVGGPRAKPGSGFISAENDDPTAHNMWHLLNEAGVNRAADFIAWNIVPWYLGSDRKISHPKARDLDEAQPALRELLGLLPELKVVVLVGGRAQHGWKRAKLDVGVQILAAPHPSPLALNGRPERRAELLAALVRARQLAGPRRRRA